MSKYEPNPHEASQTIVTDRPPVDLHSFREEMQAMGVAEIVDVALETFLEETPERLQTLEETIADQDSVGAAFAAHAIKSGAGSIHAYRLAALLQKIEELARAQDVEGAAELLPSVSAEYRAVTAYLSH